MAQDTTPAIVVYQGDGSNTVFSVPFDKGYYGEVKVLFVRRGLADYTYNPNTYTVSGRLYAWQNGGAKIYTHTPNPAIGAPTYNSSDVEQAETVAAIAGQTITVDSLVYSRAVQHDIANNLLLTWTGDMLEVGDFICIVRDTERGQPYVLPNNQQHIEMALDNLERQIQEVKDATDNALKVDPSFPIPDSHKMGPIDWMKSIIRCMDYSVRALRYANGWLDYSLDDPNIADGSKTWYHLLNTDNIKSIRERSQVEDGVTIYWTEYQASDGTWRTLANTSVWEEKIQQALDTANEAKSVADDAKDIAQDAKDIADTFDGRLTQAEQDASDAKSAVTTHIANTSNPHSVTAAQVGLGNVDNTSDADKPISTATQSALDLKANSADLATVATSGSYTDLTNKPTIGDATLTIQKNGTNIDTFTANATVDKTISIPVPVTAADVNALPDTTKYVANASMTVNTTTYVVTLQLKDQDGNNIGTAQTIDLPLETVVVSGAYDSATKEVVLTLKDGSTIRFSVADLISGLQSEITVSNKLDADLVDDSTSTHKFVTASDKTTWSGKQDAISDLSTIRSNATAGKSASDTIATYGDVVTHDASEFATATQGGKADTAVQPGDLATVATTGSYTDLSNKPTIPAAQVQSDWNQADNTEADYIKNKPTIPTVNDATITFTQGGVTKGTITLNQSSASTIAFDAGGGGGGAVDSVNGYTGTVVLTASDVNALPDTTVIPDAQIQSDWTQADNTKLDYIKNKPTLGTMAAESASDYTPTASLATVATTGSYSDLSNKPTLGTAAAADTTDFATATQGGKADTAVQPGDLATVATSGSYSDLSNKPTIPTVNDVTITFTQGGVTKGTMTTNQASPTTIALDAGGGGGSVDIDNSTITKNGDDELQAVATVNANPAAGATSPIFDWVGTLAEYEAQDIETNHPEWVCYITDDVSGGLSVYTKAQSDAAFVGKGHEVIAFQAPTSSNNYTWYRKYADGWVEQGGYADGTVNYSSNPISLPITMADTNYVLVAISNRVDKSAYIQSKTTTGFCVKDRVMADTWYDSNFSGSWEVKGMAA